ncbi:MAG TPA: CAP domain-containing protein [Actinomycetes bacterium]|nr:CAP domain-containing protein [Actinomycetes bacterium]
MRDERTPGRRAAPRHARQSSWVAGLRMTMLILLPLALAWFLLPAHARPLAPGGEPQPSSRGSIQADAARVGQVIGGADQGVARAHPTTTHARRKPAATAPPKTTAAPATTAAPTTTAPPRTTATAPAASAPVTSQDVTVADRMTQDLFGRLNAERKARGLAALGWDDALADMASDWAAHMASTNDFSHRDLSSASSLPGISKFSALGENIAWVEGYPNEAKQLHVGWMRSDGHRSNMLQPGFDSVGISVVCSGGRAWAVQNFGRLDDSDAPAMSSATPPEDPIVATALDGLQC